VPGGDATRAAATAATAAREAHAGGAGEEGQHGDDEPQGEEDRSLLVIHVVRVTDEETRHRRTGAVIEANLSGDEFKVPEKDRVPGIGSEGPTEPGGRVRVRRLYRARAVDFEFTARDI